MTTTSSIRSTKSRLSTSNTITNMTTNGNEIKSSRIFVKKPLNSTSFLQNNSATNGFNNHLKNRPLQVNHSRQSKVKSNEQNDKHSTNTNGSTSPPLVFHAIAPAPSEEINNLPKQVNGKQKDPPKYLKKSDNEPESLSSRRIARVLARTKIKTMSTDYDSPDAQSSCSEDENSTNFSRVLSSIDSDADESDNDNPTKLNKSRRLQKTRRLSNSSIPHKSETNNHTPPLSRTNIRKDEPQHSSSNDDDNDDNTNKESNLILNGNNETNRRTKLFTTKKTLHLTSTTTDDDSRKHYHRYHPLDNLSLEPTTTTTTTNESNLSSPVPAMAASVNQAPVRKVNRFQIKSIRKSQQQQILLANAIAAKSSNEDDCSVPNEKSNLQLKPSIIERKHTNTPTTDVENPILNTDNIVNGTVSALNTVENGHHRVRFDITLRGKQESAAEEEKLSIQATTVAVPTPAPPSTTASAQGEEDEEGEAVAKSPDNRFVKYAKEIGRGAFKTVYKGLDTEASVAVAWCELQDFAQFDRHERARFKEEAEMLKKLQHQNIVRFYDFWEETNPRTNKKVIILVTELMTSGSLKSYIRNFKGQKEEKRINVMKKWCRQILKGLAYLHSRNPPVIHRDLKCDNVFISSTTGCVKIGDLGLATFKTQTFAKSMRGTMEFMAPEMFDEKYDELVDIYSFGLCMLEMIIGEYPYIECKGPTAVIKRVTSGLKPDCYYKVINVDVREVIDCCIRTKKEERLSAQDLLQHSFFLDDNGLRIDLVRDRSNDLQVMIKDDLIVLKLIIVDKTKRKALWTEHESIRVRYNLKTDKPEQIADELIETKLIFDEDRNFVIQSIKDRLRAYHYEEIDRKEGVFCRNGRSNTNPTSHPGQQQLPPPLPTPLITQPPVTPIPSVTPTPSLIQQPLVEVQQQQIVKPSAEILQTKSVVATEPIPINQLSDISSSVSGSAGSLEMLDAALKKTFIKINASQGTNNASTTINDTSEQSTPLVNQDDSLIPKVGNDKSEQQQTEESGELILGESSTILLQTQSQPSTMLTNHQPQIIHNPSLPTQISQSFSHSTISPSPLLISTAISNDTVKQMKPTSASSTNETIENSHISISPSHTNETIQSSSTSDIPSTTQPTISGSLKHLDALLKSTFKNSGKASGTAHNSDNETSNTNVSSIPISINDEPSPKIIETEPILNDLRNKTDDTKRKFLDLFSTSNPSVTSLIHSQPNTCSIILPQSSPQTKSQPTSQISSNFDPLISPEKNIHELDILLKTPPDKSLSNDDTITASSSNDLSEIKLMIMDLSKTLMNKMNIIENKIDQHRTQTIQINNLLTNTVLPSLFDLADIINETSTNLDPCIRTKLENIQTNIRTTQQQQQIEMKDLMEI